MAHEPFLSLGGREGSSPVLLGEGVFCFLGNLSAALPGMHI